MPWLKRLAVAPLASSEAVFTALRTAIVRGELDPWHELDDKPLAKHFGVPRADARRALVRLSTQGLVAQPDGEQFAVVPIFLERVREAVIVAGALFALAIAEGVGRLTDGDRSRLTAYRTTSLAGDNSAMLDAVRRTTIDTVLMDTVVTRAGNPELQRVRDWVTVPLHRLSWQYADHFELAPEREAQRALVDAILSRDVHRTQRVWRSYEAVAASRLVQEGLVGVPELLANDTVPRPALSSAVAVQIRRAILTGDLPPGTPLPPRALSIRLRVPRARVVDALAELTCEGIAGPAGEGGELRVADDDTDAVDRLLDVLGVLHRLSLQLAARGDRAALARHIDRHVTLVDTAPDGPTRMAAITALTEGVDYASGNGLLAEVIDRLSARARWRASHEPILDRTVDVDILRGLQAAVAREDLTAADEWARQLFDRPEAVG